MIDTVKVFISYSWDDDGHKNWVLNVADKLTAKGIYVILDQYDLKAGKSMTKFMENAVTSADKVLLLMTPNYKLKGDNRSGGVGYEYSMVTQELFSNQDSGKFIPIKRKGEFIECAPTFLGTLLAHDMSDDAKFDDVFEQLVKIIYDQPDTVRPPLGARPAFVPTSKIFHTKALIDDATNLKKGGLTTFAKWNFDIEYKGLDESKQSIHKALLGNLLNDKILPIKLPHILNAFNKISHHPDIMYEIPLQQLIVRNHLINEKMTIDSESLHYEFSEYSDHAFWLLTLNNPFLTLFFILVNLKKVYDDFGITVDISMGIKFNSDKKSNFYNTTSPFKVEKSYSSYTIPDHTLDVNYLLKEISQKSMFKLFEKLYAHFVSENPKSSQPFVVLDKALFYADTKEYF